VTAPTVTKQRPLSISKSFRDKPEPETSSRDEVVSFRAHQAITPISDNEWRLKVLAWAATSDENGKRRISVVQKETVSFWTKGGQVAQKRTIRFWTTSALRKNGTVPKIRRPTACCKITHWENATARCRNRNCAVFDTPEPEPRDRSSVHQKETVAI